MTYEEMLGYSREHMEYNMSRDVFDEDSGVWTMSMQELSKVREFRDIVSIEDGFVTEDACYGAGFVI